MLNSVQTTPTPFNIFENKGNVVWMLNESLNQIKDSLSTKMQRVRLLLFLVHSQNYQ